MQVSPEKAGFSAQRLDRITDHIENNYEGKIAGCQILVSRHGQPAYHRSFGKMDLARDKAMADDTIFRIYSMSKPITSIALMQLFEQGRFQLNDPVSRVIPAWKNLKVYVSGEGQNIKTRAPAAPMTFKHLLNHSSGLAYGWTDHPVDMIYKELGVPERKGVTLAEFIDRLAGAPLMYDPGQRWMYSLATDVCGYLVEALSGQSFDEYLQENIFTPLGMVDTSFSVAADKVDRFAANYQRNADKSLQLVDDPQSSIYLPKPSFFSGGGGLTSTTADYYRFCEMLRQGGQLDGKRIIGSRTLHLMTRNHLLNQSDLSQLAFDTFSETAYDGVGFGLGFAMTLSEESSGTVGHGDFYWGGAASTIFWVDPIEDLVVTFMTQLMPSGTFNFRGQLKNIIYGAIED